MSRRPDGSVAWNRSGRKLKTLAQPPHLSGELTVNSHRPVGYIDHDCLHFQTASFLGSCYYLEFWSLHMLTPVLLATVPVQLITAWLLTPHYLSAWPRTVGCSFRQNHQRASTACLCRYLLAVAERVLWLFFYNFCDWWHWVVSARLLTSTLK